MLALKRCDEQWLEVTHKSGDVLRIKVYRIRSARSGRPGQVNLAFDDAPRNFAIERPGRQPQAVA